MQALYMKTNLYMTLYLNAKNDGVLLSTFSFKMTNIFASVV